MIKKIWQLVAKTKKYFCNFAFIEIFSFEVRSLHANHLINIAKNTSWQIFFFFRF